MLSKENSKTIILASKSPRRIELLRLIGLKFKVEPARRFKEENDGKLSARELVLRNAVGKALEVAEKHKKGLVIGVDTVGALHDHILEKPKHRADAFRMLKLLQGNTHEVLSGICIMDAASGEKSTYVESTKVEFAMLSDAEINKYLDKADWSDKAAAYAAQGLASLFIKAFDGDYFNVVGIPLYRINLMLKDFDIDLMDIVK
ncbi:septum formation protein Maf [Candidatus Peregrinibacteria bacterium]|nr:septum formation protein Maf [Candidatus Peregrinibacteria bacterium]